MKKVLVVAALLGVMLIVRSLKQVGTASAATLAGIGFVMLAAYAVAELGKSLSLPQVTGYILAGVVLGPSVGGIISGEVVGEMRMFNTLALGLIATSAGLELDVRQLFRLGKTLLLTTLIKVVVGVSVVAGTLLLIEGALGSLGLGSQAQLTTLALVMGVLSIGTSPSISLAVLSETRAKGRLSDLVLGAAVFKDLVVVVGLAVAIAVGRVLLQPEASLDARILSNVALELGGSFLAGSVVGLIFILYVRFVGAEMLLFVAAMILVVAELCRAFHLELLLVFIAAGFVVRNLSEFEHQLMQPLQLVALPVFVVFFANAGASVDLQTTWKILPLALALCAVRAATYFLASRLGGKWAGESRVIQKQAWLAYLPQAGVTLGLVGLASLQLPELSTPITNTGMAVVALNLLIGPITLRRALSVAGEFPKVPAENGTTPATSLLPQAPASPLPTELPPASVAALPGPLRRAHAGVADAIRDVLARFEREALATLPALPPLSDEPRELEVFRDVVTAHRAAYQALYAELSATLGRAQHVVRLEPLDEMVREQKASRLRVKRARDLPFRRMARIALGPAIARHVARSFERRLGARPQSDASAPALGASDGQLGHELDLGLLRLAELLRDAGTRRLPMRRLRYSGVEPEVRRHLQSLVGGTELEIARLVRAAWGSALLDLRREQITKTLRDIVARCVVDPAEATTAKIGPAIELLTLWLERRQVELDAERPSPATLGRLRAEFQALASSAFGDLSREFRFAATVRATLAEIQTSVAAIPVSIDCLFLDADAPLLSGKIHPVLLRSHVETLVRHLMPPLELCARSVSSAVSQLPRRVDDAIRPEWTLLEAQVESAAGHEVRALANRRLAQARRRVERVTQVSAKAVRGALDGLGASLDSAFTAFTIDVLPGPTAQGRRDAGLQGQLTRLRGALRRVLELARVSLLGAPPLEDAAAVRRALQRPGRSTLPEAVERWFDGEPVRDERIFAAHRGLLDQVLDAESSRAEMGHASVLIIGSKGAGKSSLLNMCELELPSATHLRLHAADFGPDTTLFEALANLLECPATHAGLSRHLALRAPAIFVDDLAAWIGLGRQRHPELLRLLQLVAETRSHAFWLVSVDASMLRLFNELESIEEVFTHVIRLPPLAVGEVKRLVESRLEQLSLDVVFQPSAGSRVLDRLRTSRENDRFYRALWEASGGVPARVVRLCRDALKLQGQELTLRADAIAAPASVAYVFSDIQMAILLTLHRYGPQTVHRLERELAVSVEQLRRSVVFLTACGIISDVDEGHALSIARGADWLVFEALVGARLAVG